MEYVKLLSQDETVQLDPGRLEELYLQLGETGAEEVVCRALEELTVRLSKVERNYREMRRQEMRKNARSLAAIGEQIGMLMLARVARDVTCCIDIGDEAALAATLARLMRIGEVSLSEIWEVKDMSV